MRFNFFFLFIFVNISICIEMGAKRHWPQNFLVLFLRFFFFLLIVVWSQSKGFGLGKHFWPENLQFKKTRQKSAQKFKFPQKTRNLVYKIVTAVATPCFFFIFYFFFWIYVIYTCMYMDIYLLKLVTLFLLCKHFVIKNHFTLHGKKVSNAQFTCFL